MDSDRVFHGDLREAVTDEERHQRGMLLAMMRQLRSDIEHIFTECDRWNRTHPHEPSIDPDPDGELRRLTQAMDAVLMREQKRFV